MSIYKCKMCGGSLEITEGSSTCECEFCGTKQTLPTVKDEAIQNLFNRANVLRMKSEFDKASEIYEKILQNNDKESEAYWGLILCKYGIEYVEDPATFKRIPTCHRASFDAVTADEDYKNALKYADITQRSIYESEAAQIEEIQKGIIAIAQKESPYDVFICYKETDENGKRTQDSVIANDIYYQLTQEGFKVFYAAVTLEDKLGSEYEPVIFSALNSAKVMLSIGTKPEYFNAVWVKNEWSRFLKLLKKDRSRLLIPCYKDMDAYELPEEFAHLQAQDMSKIGFINDIVRGIKKVIAKESTQPKVQENVVVQQSTANTTVTAQLKRGNMALEDHDWSRAEDFFEEALNFDPECAEAYIGKLLVESRKPTFDAWIAQQKSLNIEAESERLSVAIEDKNRINEVVAKYEIKDYLPAERILSLYDFDLGYASELSARVKQKDSQISGLEYNKTLFRIKRYAKGDTKILVENGLASVVQTLNQRISVAEKQDEASIEDVKSRYAAFLDATDVKVFELHQYAAEKKDNDYENAISLMNNAKDIDGYNQAIKKLEALDGYKECNQYIENCQSEIERLKKIAAEAAELAAKKFRKTMSIIAAVVGIVIVGFIVTTKVIIPTSNYNKALKLMDEGKYQEAIAAFEAMDGYKDSKDKLATCQIALKDPDYNAAVSLMYDGKIIDAYESLIALNGYKDSAIKASEIFVQYEIEKLKNAEVGDIVYFGSYEQDNNTSNGKEEIEWQVIAKEKNKILVISEYCLDCEVYNETNSDVTWETCTLRQWMNGTFFNEAFSTEEQSQILDSKVSADKNPEYSTNPGNEKTDKVFLLSINEVEKYFGSDEARKSDPTAYAKIKGASGSKIASGEGPCMWWLRSPGIINSKYAAFVFDDGSVESLGTLINYNYIAVRPALWINL